MRRRVIVAMVTALVGGLMYLLSQRLLHEDTLPNVGLIGLAIGAIGSTVAWHDPRQRDWFRHIRPALFIVEVTLAFIGLSVCMLEGSDSSRFALLNLLSAMVHFLFFGLIYATWWLVPGLVALLWAVNYAFAGHDRSPSPGG